MLYAFNSNSPGNIVTAANPFTELPGEFWLDANKNLVMRYQMQEEIERGVEEIVHKRITSDMLKVRNKEKLEKFRIFEIKLFEAAEEEGIDVDDIEKQIAQKFEKFYKTAKKPKIKSPTPKKS